MAKKQDGGKVGVTKEGEVRSGHTPGTPLKNIYNLPSNASDYQKLLATQSTQDAMNRARWANFQGKATDYPSGRTVPSFQYTPNVLKEMEKRGLTRDYIESWQPTNYAGSDIEEFGKGGILASIGKGAATGALAGAPTGIGAPIGALIGGLGGLFGGLLNRRQENRQEDLLEQQQQSLLDQQQVEDPTVNPLGMTQVANQYAPTFPMGGQVGTQLAELETGEPFRSPDGKIGVVKEDAQLSHANGGATLPLEVGTQILGKQKDPDTKKTFKEMGKKLAQDKAKYDKILESNKGTYSRNAAKAMNAKIDNQFTDLFQKQESLKPQSQQGAPEQFAGGGLFGAVGKGLNLLGGGDPTQITAAGAGLLGDPGGVQGAGLGFGQKVGNFLGGLGGGQGIGGLLNKGAQLAPVGYNLIQGMQPAEHLNAQDFYNPEYGAAIQGQQRAVDLLSNRRANIDPMLEANRNAQAIQAYNARTQGGLSAGAVASNRLAGTAQRMRGDQSAMAWGQNLNNQYLAQQAAGEGQLSQLRAGLGGQRAATEFNVANINQQSDAARRQMLGAGFTGISDYAQMQQLMQGQERSSDQQLEALKGMFPYFQKWFPGVSG